VKLQGFGGNDVLTGGRFADQMYAGDGDDLLFGGHGNDLLDGGRGNDVLNGDYDDDVLYGFDGHDILIGGFGADSLYGGNGEDLLIGGLSSFFYVNSVPSEQAAIQAAWASSESYASKVLKLGTTGIPVGNVTLKLATSNSVFNDLSIDLYFGRADLDWFFASQSLNFNEIGLASGGVRDLALGETLTPVL
jgi:Ca2+-binding RTX toxin-like protein